MHKIYYKKKVYNSHTLIFKTTFVITMYSTQLIAY